ncbi:MAG: hypothetical protein V7K47_28840 [Nostoc sp.]
MTSPFKVLCDGQICSLVKRGANLLVGEKMLLGQVFERFVKESPVWDCFPTLRSGCNDKTVLA